MKKIILSVAAMGLFAVSLTSCDSTKTTKSTTDSSVVDGDTTIKTSTTTTTTETVKTDVPSFSSDEVNKGLADFSKLKDEYVAALKNKNQAEVQAISTKYATWTQGASAWASKLKPDEVQKYTDYMTKLTKDWTEAAQQAVK